MISHRNVIANILQMYAYESRGRHAKRVESQVLLAPLPMSHIYALVVAAHVAIWRGDGFIVLPKYELESFLGAIQRFKVQQVLVVSDIAHCASLSLFTFVLIIPPRYHRSCSRFYARGISVRNTI